MKKVLKSKIFIFISTAILFTSLGVYAGTKYPYQASDVAYIPSNGEKINVNEALNEIYNIKTLGDATEGDIAEGKTAVVNGKLVTGTLSSINNFNIVISTSATATNVSGSTTTSAKITYNYNNGVWTKGNISVSTGKSDYIWRLSINDIKATISFD